MVLVGVEERTRSAALSMVGEGGRSRDGIREWRRSSRRQVCPAMDSNGGGVFVGSENESTKRPWKWGGQRICQRQRVDVVTNRHQAKADWVRASTCSPPQLSASRKRSL